PMGEGALSVSIRLLDISDFEFRISDLLFMLMTCRKNVEEPVKVVE
ncbi:MAG: hypothetical protein HW374_2126, partial [Bacteroidetes bacterium]|nr:hypothetical protein [Bacteroidota bacterium]